MSEKYTSGPWAIEECATGAMIHGAPDIRPYAIPKPRYIADVHAHTYDPDNERALADARLIANAPELADLLREYCAPQSEMSSAALMQRANVLLRDIDGEGVGR